jgi:hypothetical protein
MRARGLGAGWRLLTPGIPWALDRSISNSNQKSRMRRMMIIEDSPADLPPTLTLSYRPISNIRLALGAPSDLPPSLPAPSHVQDASSILRIEITRCPPKSIPGGSARGTGAPARLLWWQRLARDFRPCFEKVDLRTHIPSK